MTDVRKYISVVLLVMFVFSAMSACAPSDIAHKPDKNGLRFYPVFYWKMYHTELCFRMR